jgi:predicted component of viral defense system (DUF524 family)
LPHVQERCGERICKLRRSLSRMKIPLSYIEEGLELEIIGDSEQSLNEITEQEAMQYGEATFQLKEGCAYEYKFSDQNFRFNPENPIVSVSKFDLHKGRLSPNIFVGTTSLEIIDQEATRKGNLNLEIQSVKSEYRQDYRYMLECITEKCTELVMQIESPVSQNFETNFDVDSETLYQRFSFVKSVIDAVEFEEALQKIISSPATKWVTETEEKDIRNIRRFGRRGIQQIVSKNNRIELPPSHPLRTNIGLHSIPGRIESERKTESTDTPENRFIKHALEVFLFFCENCSEKFEKYSRSRLEAEILSAKLSNVLHQSFFRDITRPDSLQLNSPVLQRKSGYREVLNAWLKFDLAAKLIWHGGDNVYKAGKKNVAALYEYWLFFTLLDLLKEVFHIEPKEIHELIEFDKEKISLNLKQGKNIALKGAFESNSRKLHVQFSYNRSFGGGKIYPHPGSYTTTLRPDYTLSIWPFEIDDPKEAEKKELITHIHFDAKYKVNNFYDLIRRSKSDELSDRENEELIEEEKEEEKGTFKNQDLLKMHAYKDAIRRTGGAYVLYPGEGKDEPFRGFHELIPGLGAFVIKPTKESSGIEELRKFILKVVNHFLDRASQRENISSKVYQVHKNKKKDLKEDNRPNILNEPMPEMIDGVKLIPDETFVLVGYYRTPQQLDWVLNKVGKYNFRAGLGSGSLPLGHKELGAKFLVLHGPDETKTGKIYRLKETGPKIYSKQDLIDKGYPSTPTEEAYIMFEIEKEISEEFAFVEFDLTKLKDFKNYWNSSKPITVSLSELMRVVNHKPKE